MATLKNKDCKIKGSIKIGDQLVCELHNGKVCTVTSFGKDNMGQPAIGYTVGKKHYCSTAYFVFRNYARVGTKEADQILAKLFCEKKKKSFNLTKKDGSFDTKSIEKAELNFYLQNRP